MPGWVSPKYATVEYKTLNLEYKMKKQIKTIVIIIGSILLTTIIVVLSPLIYNGTNEIKIVEKSFNTLDEILEQSYLQNTTVVVDMWGTYCSPCIKEFDYAAELKERYKGKDIKFLYLCTVNRIDHTVRWKKIIHDKQLAGIHIAIKTDKLFNNIWEQHLSEPKSAKYLIPRYFIVKNGNIIVGRAAEPSSKENLYNQIDSVLNLQ